MNQNTISPLTNNNSSDHKVPVYLNVYNFWSCFNQIFDPIGMGVYHTGIQIFDDQYMFFGFDGDDTGVGFIQPFQAAYDFKQQVLLGYTQLSFFEFDDKVLDPLRLQFTGNKYDLLANNCNHFARRLTKQLKLDQKFPPKILRITDFCNLFRCCIPQCILNGRLDWFYSSQDQGQSPGYMELQESVSDQIDMKMLNEKQKQKKMEQQFFSKNKKETIRVPTAQPNKRQQHPKIFHDSLHHDVPKHTTIALRKGILPHLQNAHERASLNELPDVSPKSLGSENASFWNQDHTKVQVPKKYRHGEVKMFLDNQKKKQTYSQS